MTGFSVPVAGRLGSLLTAYRLRDYRFASSKDGTELAKAELDMLRVNDLIARHRSFCRHCKFNEALKDVPGRDSVVFSDWVH
jgi:hypothetical protein